MKKLMIFAGVIFGLTWIMVSLWSTAFPEEKEEDFLPPEIEKPRSIGQIVYEYTTALPLTDGVVLMVDEGTEMFIRLNNGQEIRGTDLVLNKAGTEVFFITEDGEKIDLVNLQEKEKSFLLIFSSLFGEEKIRFREKE